MQSDSHRASLQPDSQNSSGQQAQMDEAAMMAAAMAEIDDDGVWSRVASAPCLGAVDHVCASPDWRHVSASTQYAVYLWCVRRSAGYGEVALHGMGEIPLTSPLRHHSVGRLLSTVIATASGPFYVRLGGEGRSLTDSRTNVGNPPPTAGGEDSAWRHTATAAHPQYFFSPAIIRLGSWT